MGFSLSYFHRISGGADHATYVRTPQAFRVWFRGWTLALSSGGATAPAIRASKLTPYSVMPVSLTVYS
jgi:hypothetical protein